MMDGKERDLVKVKRIIKHFWF